MRFKIIFILTATVLLCVSACAKAPGTASREEDGEITRGVSSDYPWYDSIEALYEKADLVIEGTVLASRVEWVNHTIGIPEEDKDDPYLNPGGDNEPHEDITTIYTIEVHEVYKGNAGETMEFEQIGGEIDGMRCVAVDAAEIDIGGEYVLFLHKYEEFRASFMSDIQGIYTTDGDALTGFPALTYEELAALSKSDRD